MKKFIVLLLMFIMLACSPAIETVKSDSTQTKQEITEEDKTGYIVAVAAVGFIVLSLMILSNIMPPPGE